MGFISPQIKALKQPSKFGQTADFGGLVFITRPGEFVALQSFLPQATSIAMPVQRFDLVARSVGEDVQRAGKWAQAEFLLDEHAQAVAGFSEVDRLAVQIPPARWGSPGASMGSLGETPQGSEPLGVGQRRHLKAHTAGEHQGAARRRLWHCVVRLADS